MARRAGKAASRKARQRKAQRPTPPAAAAPPATATTTATTTTPEPPAAPAPERRSAPSPSSAHAGSSLTAQDRAEYHYVERDLRNIGILTAAMLTLLVVFWFAFNALGIV
jgi:hypothetical protein